MAHQPPSDESQHRPADESQHRPADATDWQRLAVADPIAVRDPLAEVLGMVDPGDPLVVPFREVAKAMGHACPSVSGAYRATQLALDALYPGALPVRSEVAVTVHGRPEDPGLGPMANVITHITGAADETGFTGLGGYGGRDDLRRFDPDADAVAAPGRTFDFTRTDTDETVRVTFDPDAVGVSPDDAGGGPGDGDPARGPSAMLPEVVAGDATDAERAAFLDAWHDRVQRILDSDPGENSPFTLAHR